MIKPTESRRIMRETTLPTCFLFTVLLNSSVIGSLGWRKDYHPWKLLVIYYNSTVILDQSLAVLANPGTVSLDVLSKQ